MFTQIAAWLKQQVMKVDAFLFRVARVKQSLIPEPWVQAVHTAISFGLTTLLLLFCPWWLVLPLVVALFAGIEFWFDARYEGQPLINNFHDFGFYLLGISLAMNLYLPLLLGK